MASILIEEELKELLDIHGIEDILEMNDIDELTLIVELWSQGFIKTREDLDNG